MLAEPTSAAERLAHPFAPLLEAALRSAASVLIVPATIAHPAGPIVAIAMRPDDRGIEAADAIAAVTGAEVVLVQAYKDEAPAGTTTRAPARAREVLRLAEAALADTRYLSATLGRLHERLVVMTREGFDKTAPALIASLRRVPVLVLGPAQNGLPEGPAPAPRPKRSGDQPSARKVS
jgi:hypothetical protein